jgi:hypothetical protein
MFPVPITRSLFRLAWEVVESVEDLALVLEIPVRRVLALARKLRREGKALPDLSYRGRSVLAYLDQHVNYLDFFRVWRTSETVELVAHRLGKPLVRVLDWEAEARGRATATPVCRAGDCAP